jgi:hypothetical protein
MTDKTHPGPLLLGEREIENEEAAKKCSSLRFTDPQVKGILV